MLVYARHPRNIARCMRFLCRSQNIYMNENTHSITAANHIKKARLYLYICM